MSSVVLCCTLLCYFMWCYVMLCQVMSSLPCVMLFLCYAMFCHIILRNVMLCYVMPCYVMLCYAMLCNVMLCYVMLCYVTLCYVMLRYGPGFQMVGSDPKLGRKWFSSRSRWCACVVWVAGVGTGSPVSILARDRIFPEKMHWRCYQKYVFREKFSAPASGSLLWLLSIVNQSISTPDLYANYREHG